MLQLQPLVDLFRGKSVAIVGNAESLLAEDRGDEIDAHDEVVRMNLGLPHLLRTEAIGQRTTVWAAAKYWIEAECADARHILFMKLTPLGDRHYASWLRDRPHDPLLRWTHNLEQECREFVGADPGTGIRLLWFVKVYCAPKSVSVYGMDCWDTVSNWSGKKNTPNHRPDLERAAMTRLLT